MPEADIYVPTQQIYFLPF